MPSVNPVAVVYRGEWYSCLVHFDGREQHVRRVQGVNEVGRKGGRLPLNGDGEIVRVFSDVHALQQRLHLRRQKMREQRERARGRSINKTIPAAAAAAAATTATTLLL